MTFFYSTFEFRNDKKAQLRHFLHDITKCFNVSKFIGVSLLCNVLRISSTWKKLKNWARSVCLSLVFIFCYYRLYRFYHEILHDRNFRTNRENCWCIQLLADVGLIDSVLWVLRNVFFKCIASLNLAFYLWHL